VRSADEIYNQLRGQLRTKLGDDDREVIQLLDEFWDSAYSEGVVGG
jgi:hypothetical protein